MGSVINSVEAEVEYMEDLDVGWISLVDKGANRTPFKIIKNSTDKSDTVEDKTAEEVVEKSEDSPIQASIVQSIILPASKSWDEFKANNSWAKTFNVIKTENHEVYTKHINTSEEDIDMDTLRIVRISKEDDGFALIGKPLVLKGEHIVLKGMMSAPLPVEPTAEDCNKDEDMGMESDMPCFDDSPTFGDVFNSEINNLLGVIVGAMELSALTSKLRKTIIFNALDAFKSFLGASIDSIPSQDTIAAGKAAKRGNMNKASTNDDSGGMYGTAGITDANKPSDFKGVYNNLEPGAGAPAMSSEMGTTETGSTVGAPSIGTLDLQHESGVGVGDGGIMALLTSLADKLDSIIGKAESAKVEEKEDDTITEKACGKNVEEETNKMEKSEVTLDPGIIGKFTDSIESLRKQVEKLETRIELIDGEVPEPSANVEKAEAAPVPVAKSDNPFSGMFSYLSK